MPPERLIKAERHDDRWNTAPQCGPGCSCSAVVNNRGHPRKEPVMGNAVYKEHVLGMLHRAIQRTPSPYKNTPLSTAGEGFDDERCRLLRVSRHHTPKANINWGWACSENRGSVVR